MPAMAAMAQPVDIEIHPPPSALERDRTTSAITPLPSRTRTMVPMNSPNIGDCIRFLASAIHASATAADAISPRSCASERKLEPEAQLARRGCGPKRKRACQVGGGRRFEALKTVRPAQEVYDSLRCRHLSGSCDTSRNTVTPRNNGRIRKNIVHGAEICVVEQVGRLGNHFKPHSRFSFDIERFRYPHIPAYESRPNPGIAPFVERPSFADMVSRPIGRE